MLRGDVTAAKEALSEVRAYELPVPGFDEGFRITVPELDELCGPALDGAVAEMRSTITRAAHHHGERHHQVDRRVCRSG
jgi:hypothetical protein